MSQEQVSPEQEQAAIKEVNKINNIAKALRVANIGLAPQTIHAMLNPALVGLVQRLGEVFETTETLSLSDIDAIVAEVAESQNPATSPAKPAKRGRSSKLDK